MKFVKLICLGVLIGPSAAATVTSRADAQVLVDVSRITCDQYITQRITHSRTVSIWLSGFYAGRRNNPVVDTQALDRNSNRLSRFCESHRDMPLLDAVEAAAK
jgi:acid stress chaperone HdeB